MKYCVSEILAAKELLSIPNSSFFSRSIARMVAIRNDDFIKSAFRVNKANGNLQLVKDDTNALQDLYKDHLALQRSKFGAHFQELDLATRFDCWQSINYESSTFFTDMPVAIYSLFLSAPNYDSASKLVAPLPQHVRESIRNHNDLSDIEKFPTIGVDALALARHNTGGMLVGSTTQQKASTLKSIEIFINYNVGLLKIVKNTGAYDAIIKKMLLTDIISYADNLISRNDLAPGAPQEEKGLNTLANEQGFKAANAVLKEFLMQYKFYENVSKYRLIRNRCCGHIDTSLTVKDLDGQLTSLNTDELVRFYGVLRNVFKEVCSRDFLLQMFRIEPGERIHDAVRMTGLDGLTSYDGSSYEDVLQTLDDFNDESEYELRFQRFTDSGDNDSRKYFCNCFANSEPVETLTVTYGNELYSSYSHVQIRKAHLFFKTILLDANSSEERKQAVLNLFSASSHGYPDTLLRIILDTYELNSTSNKLRRNYFQAVGELCQDESAEVYNVLKKGLDDGDFDALYHSLLAFFKIDVFSLRNRSGHVISTLVSKIIIDAIRKINRPNLQCLIAVGLLSHLYFNTKISHNEKKVRACYVAPLENIVGDFIKTELSRLSKTDASKRDVRNITASFNSRAYSTFYALLGDFYERKKNAKSALFYRTALYDEYIRFSHENFSELHNYACICYKLLDYDKAIDVAEFIVTRNPWDIERRYTLLCFYLSDPHYSEKFQREKQFLLENFELTIKYRKAIDKLSHSTQK